MSDPHIIVAAAGEDRHLFDGIADPRVCLVPLDAAVQPDLLVFPCGRHRRFENVGEVALPEAVRELIAAGRVGLVFDASLEGVAHKPDITAALHGAIRALGASNQQCVYVTQNRQYQSDYRAHCAEIGAEPVAVRTHDYWIWDALSSYEGDGADVFEARLQAFRDRRSLRARRFVSLNRTPRPPKLLFLMRLLRDGLWDEGSSPSEGSGRSRRALARNARPWNSCRHRSPDSRTWSWNWRPISIASMRMAACCWDSNSMAGRTSI